MYYRYFGLKEEPFSIAVNPRYLFMSARHRDALAHLLYGVGAGGGFILLTGEVGTGKTTINRCLLEQLPADTDIAIILNPALDAEELLATACEEFDIGCERGATLKDLTDSLHVFLLENHRRGRNTVLLIDEAQHLQFEVLEQIRLLTNLETNTKKLLQIILVGQPELAAMLSKPELRQLSQRITARYDLRPLNREETDAYIRHRLQVAGLPANQELFPPRVVRAIYRESRGIPRLINVLCDRMLLGSYGQNQSRVSMMMLRQAVREVMGEELGVKQRLPWAWGLGLLALAAMVGVPTWYFVGGNNTTTLASTIAPRAAEPVVAAAPEPPVTPEVQFRFSRDRQLALASLAGHLGQEVAPVDVCNSLSGSGWRCETLEVESWGDLLEFDRPAVLTLVSPSRFTSYAVLVAVEDDTGIVLNDAGRQRVPLAELGALWGGAFSLIWQPPGDYAGPVSRGDRGPIVAWLARTFASLDGQARPLAEDEFNAALEARVRLFQRQFNLRDDGVVGLKTLLKLNAVRGEGMSLQRNDAGLAQLEQG
jgi:general secretion pathway protein A